MTDYLNPNYIDVREYSDDAIEHMLFDDNGFDFDEIELFDFEEINMDFEDVL